MISIFVFIPNTRKSPGLADLRRFYARNLSQKVMAKSPSTLCHTKPIRKLIYKNIDCESPLRASLKFEQRLGLVRHQPKTAGLEGLGQ